MVQVPLTWKPAKFILIDRVSEKYLCNSDIFSKDVICWSGYLLQTLLLHRCFSNISLTQINDLTPKRELNMCLQKLQLNITVNVS